MPAILATSAASSAASERYQPHIIALLRQQLAAGGQARLRVQGGSMLPLIRPGDTVCIAPCQPQQVRPGEIIVFQRGSTLIMHRLLACSAHSLQTRGDSCRLDDAPIHPSDVLGRVVAIERDGVCYPLPQHAWPALYRVLGRLARLKQYLQRLPNHLHAAACAPRRAPSLLVLLDAVLAGFRLLLRGCLLLAARHLPG
jgi:signal peptidase